MDNWRIGAGTTLYLPVEVAGGLLSMGDVHWAQGDAELNGCGVEASANGAPRGGWGSRGGTRWLLQMQPCSSSALHASASLLLRALQASCG